MRKQLVAVALVVTSGLVLPGPEENARATGVDDPDASFAYDENTRQFELSMSTPSGALTHTGTLGDEKASGAVRIEGLEERCTYSLELIERRFHVTVDLLEHGSGSFFLSEDGGVSVESNLLTDLEAYESGQFAEGIKNAFMTLNMLDRSWEEGPRAGQNAAMVMYLVYCLEPSRFFGKVSGAE